MKLFGYLDDLLVWFFNWQVSMGWWNFIIVPLEFVIIVIFHRKFIYRNTSWM